MKMQITKTGNYKDFSDGLGLRAVKLEAGTVRDFPDGYGNYLVTQGLATLAPAALAAPVETPSAKSEEPQPATPAAPAATASRRKQSTKRG